MDRYQARDLMRLIAEGTHVCGDPGMQFDTTINEWHTCPETDRIFASNPCSEYMFLNDSACNLASINLMKFVKADGEFDVVSYKAAIRTLITAQEIIVDNASYPSEAIGKNSHAYRPLGLGYANLGALLMSRGLPYDSDAGRDYAAALTALMTGEAYAQSARIARDHGGPFSGYEPNREPFLRVMRKHRDSMRDVNARNVPSDLYQTAKSSWDDAVELGEQFGYRNAQATVLAPTGTIGFMMDCDTTGVEPDIALVKYKKLVGGGMMKIVNQTVPMALRKLGYTPQQVDAIVDHINVQETIEGAPGLKESHLAGVRLRVQGGEGPAVHPLHGPHQDDGRHAAVHLGRHQQDRQRAERGDGRGDHAGLHPVVEAGRQGDLDLPRRQQADAAAQHVEGQDGGRDRPAGGGVDGDRPGAPEAARRAPRDHAQVRHPGPRRLHHGRPVRGRPAGRDLPGDGEGRLDDLGVRRRLRAGDFLRAAVRRAAAGARGQVQPRPVRAVGHDEATRRSGSRSRSSTTSSGGWRASSCRTKRSSTPASTAANSKRPRAHGGRAADARLAHRLRPSAKAGAYSTIQNQEDAPPCSTCGSIMIRSGACYKCSNCGNTSGCA